MRWLRLVGSLKTLVAFTKEPYTRDYILQKRRIFLMSLLIIATPYPTIAPWMTETSAYNIYNIQR